MTRPPAHTIQLPRCCCENNVEHVGRGGNPGRRRRALFQVSQLRSAGAVPDRSGREGGHHGVGQRFRHAGTAGDRRRGLTGERPHLLCATDRKNPGKKIDYVSEVENGTLLANIDPTVYKSQVDQAEANLAHANADLGEQGESGSDRGGMEAGRTLRPKKAIADTDYDLDEANYKVAVANLEVGKATIKQAEAAVTMAKRNLDYCTIKSPVKGVIIDRRVNIGQTVVSAMSVPACS